MRRWRIKTLITAGWNVKLHAGPQLSKQSHQCPAFPLLSIQPTEINGRKGQGGPPTLVRPLAQRRSSSQSKVETIQCLSADKRTNSQGQWHLKKKKKKGADKRINEMCFMIYLRATPSLEKDEIAVTYHDVNEPCKHNSRLK